MSSFPTGNRLIFWPLLKRCALLGAGVDVLLLFLFHYLGSPLLAWINILSVAIYLSAYQLLQRGRNRLAVGLMRFEVLAHSTLGVLMLGWQSGAYYYMLLFIPLIIASAKPQRAFKVVAVLWLYYIGLFLASTLWLHPIQPISNEATITMHAFSITVVFVMLAYLSHLYIRAVYRAQDRLRHQASTDALTGLCNRHQILEIGSEALNKYEADATPFSIIIADIDYFKKINDTYGHEGGDHVLRAISGLLHDALRPQDVAARWGGEEFLVILPGTNIREALEVAERLRQRVHCSPIALELSNTHIEVPVSLTLGVSQYRRSERLDECIARADKGLYRGKELGRNRVEPEELDWRLQHDL